MNYEKIYPSIDLHGEYSFSAEYLTKQFIDDNLTLKNYKICIIHGIGAGVLKNKVHEILKNDKRVKDFKLDFFNPGVTIVELREELKWAN